MSWIDTKQMALMIYRDYHTKKKKLPAEHQSTLDTMFSDHAILANGGKEVLAEYKRLFQREQELQDLRRQYGQVSYKGDLLPLTDKPRMRIGLDGKPEFFATAIDIADEEYNVTWKCLPGFSPDNAVDNLLSGIDPNNVTVVPYNTKGLKEEDLRARLSGVGDDILL